MRLSDRVGDPKNIMKHAFYIRNRISAAGYIRSGGSFLGWFG